MGRSSVRWRAGRLRRLDQNEQRKEQTTAAGGRSSVR